MANVKLGTKAVGSIVKIKVNGASKDFIVVQQGNAQSSKIDCIVIICESGVMQENLR